MAASDYWELVERSVTLGTAASVLAGLRSATEVLPLVGETALADADPGGGRRRWPPRCTGSSAARGYPRMLDDSAADAAVTFLAAPIGGPGVDDAVLTAMGRAQAAMARPAGGRGARGAGGRTTASAGPPRRRCSPPPGPRAGERDRAEALLGWLGDHRTDAGSFPEKVLFDGRPAAVAPLAWTAALVVIARHELVHA